MRRKKASSLRRWITLGDIGRSEQVHPHVRNMFIFGFTCQLRVIVTTLFLSFSLGLIIDASILRKCDVGALNGDLRRSPTHSGTDSLARKAENRRTKGASRIEWESEGMKEEGERRARSFVSRGAEAGIQALLSGTPFLRVSTLSRRVSYVKDFLPRSPSSSPSSSLLPLPPQLLSSVLRFVFSVPPSLLVPRRHYALAS